MRAETRRAALIATLRVAMCTVAVGCGPKTAADAPPETHVATAAGSEDCNKMTADAWNDANERIAGVSDDALKTCCQTVATAHDADLGADWKDRGNCCALLDWHGSATCTPWGPPVPPAMA